MLNYEDSHGGSPWFGSWYWRAVVTPVSQGGIPPDIARVELKMTFKDGGHYEFVNEFETLKQNLHHCRDIERETGQRISVPDEPLPAYEGPAGSGTGSGTANAGRLAAEDPPARSDSSSRARGPDEPPPAYEEAQAQSISMRLEDHIRGSVDRGEHD